MSYHYQINNDYFDSTSYLPQVQMHMHAGYDFYSSDPTNLMTQTPQIGPIPNASQQNLIATQQHEQSQQQSNSDHVVPYGWRPDWTSSNNINSNLGLNTINVQSNWTSPIQHGNSFESSTGTIGIHDAFRQASSGSFYLDPLPTSSNETCGILNEKKNSLVLNQSHPQKPANTRSTPKPFRCLICCKSFSQAANLTAHKRIHTGEKPFTCSVCHRPFSQSSSLVTHKRTHTGERPYPCAQCDKAFTDSSTLTKHLRTHTGQKPYGCPLCLMRFTQSGNLHRHMKTHKP